MMKLITVENRKWWVLAATTLMMSTLNFDVTAVNLALTPIVKNLETDLLTAQWIINGFVIACGALTVVSGRFGDIFGHRKIFLIGTTVFIIACLGAGFAQNAWSIISLRILQGVGMALCFPMIYAINFNVFPVSQRGVALGILTAGIGLAQASGPTLGGILIQVFNWRWIFFIQTPIALISTILIALTYKDTKKNLINEPIDYIGIVLLTTSLFLLMICLNEARYWGLQSFLFYGCLILSLFLLYLFVKVELKTSSPLVHIRLFSNNTFLLVNLIRMSYSFVFFTFLFLIGIFLQNILNYSAAKSGIFMLFMTAIFGLISPLSGKWIDKSGTRLPLMVGMLILAVGFISLAELTLEDPDPNAHLLLGMLCIGIASGILLPSTSIAAISTVRKDLRGAATGLFYTISFLGGAIGVAISGIILASLSYNHLKILMHISGLSQLHIPDSVLETAASGLRPTSLFFKYSNIQTIMKLKWMINISFTQAFSIIMWICAGLAIISFILTFFTKNSNKISIESSTI